MKEEEGMRGTWKGLEKREVMRKEVEGKGERRAEGWRKGGEGREGDGNGS